MAYERTDVPVVRSQDALRKLIQGHNGFGWAAVSEQDPEGKLPSTEGFEAKVMLDGSPCVIRVVGIVRKTYDRDQEERRIWRVLYYHMKSAFEDADSGVIELRKSLLAFIVTPNGQTVGDQIIPRLKLVQAGKEQKLLPSGE